MLCCAKTTFCSFLTRFAVFNRDLAQLMQRVRAGLSNVMGTFATKEEAEVANAAALEVLNAVNADPTKEAVEATVKRAKTAVNDLAFDCIVTTDLATVDKLVGSTSINACFCEVKLNQTKVSLCLSTVYKTLQRRITLTPPLHRKANECYVKKSNWFEKVNGGNYLLCRLCKDKGLPLDKCLKKKNPKGNTGQYAAHLRLEHGVGRQGMP